MKAVILAAGKGERMKPLTEDRPKALLRLNCRTVLDLILRKLKEVDIESLAVVVSGEYLDIFREATSGWGMDIQFFVQQRPGGTAEALQSARDFLRPESSFLLLYGDQIFDFSLKSLINYHSRHSYSCVFIVEQVSSGESGNRVTLKNNEVVAIKEFRNNPPQGFTAAGICILSGRIFQYLESIKPAEDNEVYLTDAIDLMLKEGEPAGFIDIPGKRLNLTRPEDIERAKLLLST